MKQLFLKSLIDNNQDVMIFFSKFIAISVRNELEDFHVKHLSDNQMKELNPLIRNGIYSALFSLANTDRDRSAHAYVDFLSKSIPNYWEDPELDDLLQSVLLKSNQTPRIEFKSAFLNEQLKIGNIFYKPITGCIHIAPSYNFKEVDKDNHKHRTKISALLSKEEYVFLPGMDGYMICFESNFIIG